MLSLDLGKKASDVNASKRRFAPKLNKKGIATVIILLVFFYAATTAEFRCIFVDHFGFEKVGPNIFVQSDMSPVDVQILLSTIEKSKERVVNLFGAMESNTIIVVGTDSNELEKFGLPNKFGATRSSPFGPFVLIGINGLNEDVIAHELVHAEFFHRIGWYRFHKVPMWFHEGLGTQVDNRPRYSEESWTKKTNNGRDVPNLNTIVSVEEFQSGDINTTRYHYVIAKHEVMEWLKIAGEKGLLQLIDKIKNGEDFYNAYEQIKSS